LSRSTEAPARAVHEKIDQGVLRIAFGDQQVIIRSHDAEVLETLGRIFVLMRSPPAGQVVGQLEVCVEDGQYAVRGDAGLIVTSSAVASVVRYVQYEAIRRLIEARPDLLWLHAGAAALGGRVVLFPGPRGGGKSTIVTSLCQRAWRYLSDDVVPLDPGAHLALPFPQTPAVREYPGQEMPPKWLRMPNKAARSLNLNGVCSEPAPVAAVVRLSYQPGVRAELSVTSPATTALHLLGQCWNFESHGDAAVGTVCALAERVPGFSLSFSEAEAATDLVARALEARL
jgi:hypothetical protein